MPSVFLSYAYADQEIARLIAKKLVDRGVHVWFDEAEIQAGDSIKRRITEGIRSSDYLIVLLSENSNKSVWVEREISSAFEHFEDAAKTIIPVRIDQSPLLSRFESIRYVDMSEDLVGGYRRTSCGGFRARHSKRC